MMTIDAAIERALKTWRTDGDQLLHAHMGLVAEVGEWVDLHKKAMFKPGFELTREMELDELGDIWYYVRVLMHMNQWVTEWITKIIDEDASDTDCSITFIIFQFISVVGRISNHHPELLIRIVQLLLIRLDQLDCTLDELTNLNWQKLKPGSIRGEQWKAVGEKKCMICHKSTTTLAFDEIELLELNGVYCCEECRDTNG